VPESDAVRAKSPTGRPARSPHRVETPRPPGIAPLDIRDVVAKKQLRRSAGKPLPPSPLETRPLGIETALFEGFDVNEEDDDEEVLGKRFSRPVSPVKT